MKSVLLVAALAFLSDHYAGAQTLSSIALRGDELSTLYGIGDVDEGATPTARVRVYSMSLGDNLERETLVLQVAADSRPYRMRRAVVVWDIGNVLRSVDSVAVADNVVTVSGSADGGRQLCKYAFTFDGGDLSNELTVLGCESEP